MRHRIVVDVDVEPETYWPSYLGDGDVDEKLTHYVSTNFQLLGASINRIHSVALDCQSNPVKSEQLTANKEAQ